MDKRLRILGIRGVPARHGGFETFAERLCHELVGKGWSVTVYCQVEGWGSIYEDSWRGVRRVMIPVPGAGSISSILFDLASNLHAALESDDLCLTLGYNTALFCSILRLRGARNIINMDGVEWRRGKWGFLAKSWFYINERLGCWLGDDLVADHPEIDRHLRTRGVGAKLTMIPYGGEVPQAPSVEFLRRWGLEPYRYFTLIARPEPENSILEMVSAFSARHRGCKLVVLGDYSGSGDYCQRVRAAASDEVLFVGPVYDAEPVGALRTFCLAYLHGHQVGGTNPSLVEALACGNPVIAHDNKYNRWVAGPTALFFSSVEECSECIGRFIGEETVRRVSGAGSYSRFIASFQWPEILWRYQRLFHRVAGLPAVPELDRSLLIYEAVADSTRRGSVKDEAIRSERV